MLTHHMLRYMAAIFSLYLPRLYLLPASRCFLAWLIFYPEVGGDMFLRNAGTAKGMLCHLKVTDNTSARSRPYQRFHPCLQILREIVKDLLRLSC
jgi:hypothetical protein